MRDLIEDLGTMIEAGGDRVPISSVTSATSKALKEISSAMRKTGWKGRSGKTGAMKEMTWESPAGATVSISYWPGKKGGNPPLILGVLFEKEKYAGLKPLWDFPMKDLDMNDMSMSKSVSKKYLSDIAGLAKKMTAKAKEMAESEEVQSVASGDDDIFEKSADPVDVAVDILYKGATHPIIKGLERELTNLKKAMADGKKANDGYRKVGAGDTVAIEQVKGHVMPALSSLTKTAEVMLSQINTRVLSGKWKGK